MHDYVHKKYPEEKEKENSSSIVLNRISLFKMMIQNMNNFRGVNEHELKLYKKNVRIYSDEIKREMNKVIKITEKEIKFWDKKFGEVE